MDKTRILDGMNNFNDIMNSMRRNLHRSFSLSVRADCQKLLTGRWLLKEMMDKPWNTSWGNEYEYFLDVTSSESEMDMYDLVQDNRWMMK